LCPFERPLGSRCDTRRAVLGDSRMDELETVKKRIHEHDDTVGAVGLGYVGLSLFLRFAETSFRVTESRV
jgi:hypothetical protein